MTVQYQVGLYYNPFATLGNKGGTLTHQHWMGIGWNASNFFGVRGSGGGPIYGERTTSGPSRLISPSGSSETAAYREGRTEEVSHMPKYILVNYEVVAG